MSVMAGLLRTLVPGTELRTPDLRRGTTFQVTGITVDEIQIQTGRRRSELRIPVPLLAGSLEFLRGKGWVKIGASHNNRATPGTLEDYLDRTRKELGFPSQDNGPYVAGILRYFGVVAINGRTPNQIRLVQERGDKS